MPTKYKDIPMMAAKGISYFTPAQSIPPGTASNPQSDGSKPPKLFQPLQIRGMVMQNRIALAPLQQYSCEDGHMTDWHITHLGGIAQRGPGFLMFEGTAILPEGRATPQDAGLWQDSQIEPMRRVVQFVHSQGQQIGIQLFHAGRKASRVAGFLAADAISSANVGGWPDRTMGPSAIPYGDHTPVPRDMTIEDIEKVKAAWVAAIKRALKAGVDFIEILIAHGFLLHSFISPVSNQRTDRYGGSFENRIRLPLEIAELTRQNVPDTMPIMVRLSATDWLEESQPNIESWKLEDSVQFSKVLADQGFVDVLDISSGGSHPAQRIQTGPCFQVPFAKAIKAAVGDKLLVGAVGMIHTGQIANELLTESGLDFVLVGRGFQKNPGLVWAWAEELGVDISMANQIRWGFSNRGAENLYVIHKNK